MNLIFKQSLTADFTNDYHSWFCGFYHKVIIFDLHQHYCLCKNVIAVTNLIKLTICRLMLLSDDAKILVMIVNSMLLFVENVCD